VFRPFLTSGVRFVEGKLSSSRGCSWINYSDFQGTTEIAELRV